MVEVDASTTGVWAVLSQQFSEPPRLAHTTPVLIVSPIQWNIVKDIRAATLIEPAPLGGPEGKTYVPISQRQSLLGSVHQGPGSGHPGSQRTLSLLLAHYWCPLMSSGTSVFAQSVPSLRLLIISP